MSRERRESYKCGLRLFLCLKGSDKFEQEVFEALYGNQSGRDSTDLYFSGGQSGYRIEYCDVRLSGTLSGAGR